MSCALENHLVEEHANMRDKRLGTIIHTCPVVDRQICLWCCLHMYDAANPLSRNQASDRFPEFVSKTCELSGRDLDSIWETCSRCHVR